MWHNLNGLCKLIQEKYVTMDHVQITSAYVETVEHYTAHGCKIWGFAIYKGGCFPNVSIIAKVSVSPQI